MERVNERYPGRRPVTELNARMSVTWEDIQIQICGKTNDRDGAVELATEEVRYDIETREDIARLVETFYTRTFADPVLGPIFTDMVRMDLAAHMPIMCDFWENILFGARKYPGGMMMVHFRVHAKTSLELHHFQRWLDYWVETADELFEGERATIAKVHASRAALAMANRFEELPGGPPVGLTPRSYFS